MGKRTFFAFASGGFLFSLSALTGVKADGLMESPPARNWYCGYTTKPDEIPNHLAKYPACSTSFAALSMAGYNFMTVVTHTAGRAKANPLPAHVCSFDAETWKGVQTPWDVPMDWPVTPIAIGPLNIVWNAFWGGHFDDTRDFSYWITKPDFKFSPTRELTWDDFEVQPFCVDLYDDKNPASTPDVLADKAAIKYTTRCTVPARSGRHVIYGEWGRSESTLQRFHGCIDVSLGTDPVKPAAIGKTGPARIRKRVDALGRGNAPARAAGWKAK